MTRLQLALNVADLDASIDFYTQLFQTPPAKVREGYANFEVATPPLKLVLFTGQGEAGSLNHLGIEVDTVDAVTATANRLANSGVNCTSQDTTTCCFAEQSKVWAHGPDSDWEIYTVLGDAATMHPPTVSCC